MLEDRAFTESVCCEQEMDVNLAGLNKGAGGGGGGGGMGGLSSIAGALLGGGSSSGGGGLSSIAGVQLQMHHSSASSTRSSPRSYVFSVWLGVCLGYISP